MITDTPFPHKRKIICHLLGKRNENNPHLGFVRPIADIENSGKLRPIVPDEFCHTMKAFITSQYHELEKRYPDRKLFQLEIKLSDEQSENVDPEDACRYVATAFNATDIRPKDFFEIIRAPLPPAHDRTILPEESPGTHYILLQDTSPAGDHTYGPFKWSRIRGGEEDDGIVLEFPDGPLPNVRLEKYQTYRIKSSQVDAIAIPALHGHRRLINGLSALPQGSYDYYDYASEEEIVLYCVKIASGLGRHSTDISRMESLLADVRRTYGGKNKLITDRLDRMTHITRLSQDARKEISDAMGGFLYTDNGQDIVRDFVKRHEKSFIEHLREQRQAEIEGLVAHGHSELEKLQQRVDELRQKKNELHDQMRELSHHAQKGPDLIKLSQADKFIQERRTECETIEKEYQQWVAKRNLSKRVDTLHSEIDYLERRRKEADEACEQITKTLNERNTELQRRMVELRPFVELLNGSFISPESTQEMLVVQTTPFDTDKVNTRQNDVIQGMQAALAAHDRHMEINDVANLLITLQQSFLTVFAGLPGTGKTSLARLMASAQQINARLREVAVARGWASQKDLIGYYNPLTHRFQAASTGMYSFLKALSAENDADCAMAYALLDEANLSPMEHYWSAFMGLTDKEGDRTLRLGNETIHIPGILRFIATINYDGTTEPLSPRLIDRAPVIVLTTPKERAETAVLSETIKAPFPIPAKVMETLFGVQAQVPELNGEERPIYGEIRRTLLDFHAEWGRPIAISHRKENAIRQYCARAQMMNADHDLTALDYAVQQHILPLIRGNGAGFCKRLKVLQTVLSDNKMSRSLTTLERMIAFGDEDLQTYDFFCW